MTPYEIQLNFWKHRAYLTYCAARREEEARRAAHEAHEAFELPAETADAIDFFIAYCVPQDAVAAAGANESQSAPRSTEDAEADEWRKWYEAKKSA